MKKTIVLISNPFGFGPTGKAVAVAEEFLRRGYSDIVFLGSKFILDIVGNNFNKIVLDERNQDQLEEAILKIENPFVVSSQNRFAIFAANKLNIPSAFIDGLSWFWGNIPPDHLLADYIFWMNYPNVQSKIPSSVSNKIFIIPAIIDCPAVKEDRAGILIHLGGCKNPLTDIFPYDYLDLISDVINHKDDRLKIKIAGGMDALDYLKKKITNKAVIFLPNEHNEFVKHLSVTKHFITTAGQTATLEAFCLGVPTSFIPPMNLSQLALMDLLRVYDAIPQSIFWSDLVDLKTDLRYLSEKEAILEFNALAKKVKSNKDASIGFISKLEKIIDQAPNNEGQSKFISEVGINGASKICDILIDNWKLL